MAFKRRMSGDCTLAQEPGLEPDYTNSLNSLHEPSSGSCGGEAKRCRLSACVRSAAGPGETAEAELVSDLTLTRDLTRRAAEVAGHTELVALLHSLPSPVHERLELALLELNMLLKLNRTTKQGLT